MSDYVSEYALDEDEIFRRGGRNCGDEDFALFKCPLCEHVYMMEYEVDTVYLDGLDLSKRVGVFPESFDCVGCGRQIPVGAWVGPNATPEFQVTWEQLARGNWLWAIRLLLKPEDVEIALARIEGGRNTMTVTHKPTGICRSAGPPLTNPAKQQGEMLREIQTDLIKRGLTRHLLDPG